MGCSRGELGDARGIRDARANLECSGMNLGCLRDELETLKERTWGTQGVHLGCSKMGYLRNRFWISEG